MSCHIISYHIRFCFASSGICIIKRSLHGDTASVMVALLFLYITNEPPLFYEPLSPTLVRGGDSRIDDGRL